PRSLPVGAIRFCQKVQLPSKPRLGASAPASGPSAPFLGYPTLPSACFSVRRRRRLAAGASGLGATHRGRGTKRGSHSKPRDKGNGLASREVFSEILCRRVTRRIGEQRVIPCWWLIEEVQRCASHLGRGSYPGWRLGPARAGAWPTPPRPYCGKTRPG